MKKRMKKLASLLLSVSMTFSMISFPVYATPADDTENETAVTTESPETEEPADATGETTEPVAEEQETTQPETTNPDTTEPETQPEVTPIKESYSTYTVRAEDIDVSGVTPHGVSVDEEVEVDEDDPVMSSIEEELKGMTVLNEDGESVALTEEQINTILYLWGEYQTQWKDNADVLGVQMPFFLSYNDEKDGLGVLGEMLVLARVPVDDVRTGAYSYDDLLGMIQNFYYADQFGLQYYRTAIESARDEALKKVDESGAKTLVQKMLVLNDWIAHNATFDMSYIMQDEDGNPIMVAENPQKHEHYDEIHDAMYDLYEDQIRQQFHDQIYNGIVASFRQQYYEGAIKNIVKQNCLDNGMTEEEAEAQAEAYMEANAEAIEEDAAGFVEKEFGEEAAAQISAGADDFIKDAEENGVEVDPENAPGYKMTIEEITQQQMDQPLDDLGGMTPNEAIPVYAEQAATGLTEGIIGAWEGNHIGILAEGYGVCAGYAKAFAYLLQYMSPEVYGVTEDADMSVASNWKTAEDLYYDEDGNLDIDKDYVVDMVRITFDAETSMFGEESMFGEVHFWNAVKVDGTWYYVDPCYTDIYVECMSRDRVEIDGTMNHMYFMFSHTTATEMYDGNMKEIATLYADVATETKYEDSWLARVATNTYSDGTNFYYMYDSTDQLSMMREFQNMQNSGSEDFDESDFEALMEGSDPTYSIVYHPITENDVVSGGADSDFTPLVEFNHKEDEDDDTSVARVRNASGEMEENELLTELFAQYKEECDIYPSIKMTCALYNNKIYFNLSNCILSYDLSSCEIETVKVYDTVSGKRDNTIAFGGMAFSVCDESGADFTFENHPIAAMTIKDDGKMYVSVATNLGFISGKSAVDDTDHYGYAFEESNYNPDYSTYMQGFDIDESQKEEMGYSEETNDNDEFMWSAVFVDKISMSGLCTSHTYESVTVEPTCGRDGYTENRCTTCGAVEAGSRVVNEGTACDHHYVHFYEQYYTKDDNGNWNSGDCYVCTVCGFAIEEPTEPTKNSQETDEEFEERQAEYEEEKAIYDHAVETAGHTYEATNADNVTWGEDNMTASVSGDVHCAVCEGRKLDALGANDYDPKASDNADNKVLSATLDSAVELTVEEDAKTVSGSCDSGLTINYTATGTAEDGKKIAAKKTETTEAGRHDYVATWTWAEVEEEEGEESEDTEAQSEEAEIPYKATAKIECSVCHDAPTEELEGTVEVDEENSVAATCEEAGQTVYKATVSYTKAEGEDPYTFETSGDDLKVDEIPATGHSFKAEFTWTDAKDDEGNVTGEAEVTVTFTCENGCETTYSGDQVEVDKALDEEESVAATCEEDGKNVYTATATVTDEEGNVIATDTDTHEITLPALGHEYEAEFTWVDEKDENGKNTGAATATATFTCKHEGCDSEYKDVEAEVVKDEENSVAVTCEEDGKNVYTATATAKDAEDKEVASANDTHEVVIEKTGHSYDEDHAEWTWADDHKSATLVLTCTTCGKETDPIAAEVAEKSSDATCTEAGTTVYSATAEYEGVTYTDEQTVSGEALGHDYKETWDWTEAEGEEGHKATLTLTCSRCEETHTVDAEVALTNQKAATCTEDGVDEYTATATYDGKEYTNVHKDEYKATGHTFVDDDEHAVWSWSEDHKTATLVLKCTAGDLETDPIEAEVEEKVVDATCTEEGTVTYTATATYEDKEYTDTQTVTSEALGHDYKETWDWTEAEGEEGHKATLTLTCSRCEETHTVDATVELTSQKAATCTEDGADEYKATATYDGKEYTDVHTDTYKATGHTYADDAEHAAWTWTESTDGDSEAAYAASLVLTCTTCGTPTDALKADVTTESSDATCTEAGTTVYTAKVTHEGKDYTDSKTVTGEALGHNYEAKWTWTKVEDENAEIPYTAKVDLTCSRCDDKVEGIDATVVLKDKTEATCTEDGEIVYSATATYDGKDYNSEKSVAIKATGHEWGEWETVKEPTETEAGSRQRTCAKCGEVETEAIGTVERPDVQYRTHVQTYGWQEWVENGEMSGTSGESKRLEAIEIKLDNSSYSGSIEYSTHVQTYGWQDPVVDGALSGTSGESKRLEAIKINLTGDIANYYDVYYRVHAQTYGWLDWAKNGEVAGTAGLSKRLEGIEIVLVVKGEDAPGDTDRPYVTKEIGYSTHVQTYGWQATKYNGEVSGTSGESKRLEAIKINLVDPLYDGSIEYTTHVQTYGWQDYVSDGELSGTSGESKRLEAIRIRLKGDMADKYDVYYRVHAQNIGWMGWAKNGQAAGTAGYSYRLEAIQIILVKKGADAPGSTSNHFVQK